MDDNNKKRRRAKCHRKFPINELFKMWLEELRDKATANGSKLGYVYGKALTSVKNCPLPLKTARDAKYLDNVGEKIVKILDDRLEEFKESYGEPTFDNIQMVGVKVDVQDTNDAEGEETPTKKRAAKRRSSPRQYIPGIRTGGYAIIRCLYDAYKEQNGDDGDGEKSMPFIGKQELQVAAQHYCNESLKVTTGGSAYTAWSSVNTLIKHDLVRMTHAKGTRTMQYALTKAGVELGKRLTDAANGDNDHRSTTSSIDHGSTSKSSPVAKKPKKKTPARKKEPVKTLVSPILQPENGDSTSAISAKARNSEAATSTVSKNLFSPTRYDNYSNNDAFDDGANYDVGFDDAQNYDVGFDDVSNYDAGLGDDQNFDADFDKALNSDVGGETDPLPLFRRISDHHTPQKNRSDGKSVRLGYVYVDGNGRETWKQDNAHLLPDEEIGALLCLVKTTDAYVKQNGQRLWRQCVETPSFIEKEIGDGNILMYLGIDSGDEYAPGILETENEFDNADFGEKNGGEQIAKSKIENSYDAPSVKSESHSKYENNYNLEDQNFAEADTFPSTSSASTIRTSEKKSIPKFIFSSSSQEKTSESTSSTFSSQKTLSDDVVVLEPGTFEIILLVDFTELVGGVSMFGEKSKNRKSLLADALNELKIDYESTNLEVGDFLFIAREKKNGGGSVLQRNSPDRELVLGPVIERKRMDDLASSIRDRRYEEQKSRLGVCGVHKVIYLVEGNERSISTSGVSEQALRSAMVGTQVCDGFDVIRKKDYQDTAKYLFNLLMHLRERFGNKRLISRQPDSLSVDELMEIESDEIALPTFREFALLSAKRRTLTVGEAFAKCLTQFPGVSAEKAEAIRKVYPTFSHLIEAYEACDGDEVKEDGLLETISCGHLDRNLGSQASKKIARFFCAKEPFTK